MEHSQDLASYAESQRTANVQGRHARFVETANPSRGTDSPERIAWKMTLAARDR